MRSTRPTERSAPLTVRALAVRNAALVAAALVAAALVPLSPSANAQTARQSLRDIDRFREALEPCVANVTLTVNGRSTAMRLRRTAEGFDVIAPQSQAVSVSDATVDMPTRLLAALLATGELEDVLEPLRYEIDDVILGLTYIEPGDVLVQRVGNGAAHVAFEPGIARTRELVLGRGEARWVVRATAYGDIAGGWWPTEASVWRGDEEVLRFEVQDAAPSASALSPLLSAPPPRPRLPRLPL